MRKEVGLIGRFELPTAPLVRVRAAGRICLSAPLLFSSLFFPSVYCIQQVGHVECNKQKEKTGRRKEVVLIGRFELPTAPLVRVR
ncbi:hypothetical protein, partial [Escherichia coli]|uniref:hypothetical protein n=1 Tax=Escherichia coli TaxID=562 RepID=UPI0030048225